MRAPSARAEAMYSSTEAWCSSGSAAELGARIGRIADADVAARAATSLTMRS
jgi:hypothetical protein